MPTYLEGVESKSDKLLEKLREDEEFSSQVRRQADSIVRDAAYLFATVCKEYKRRNDPLWKRFLRGGEHHWGVSIFGPILADAGLLTTSDGDLVPTEKGLEIYRRHTETTRTS